MFGEVILGLFAALVIGGMILILGASVAATAEGWVPRD